MEAVCTEATQQTAGCGALRRAALLCGGLVAIGLTLAVATAAPPTFSQSVDGTARWPAQRQLAEIREVSAKRHGRGGKRRGRGSRRGQSGDDLVSHHVIAQSGALAIECAAGTYVREVSFATYGTPVLHSNGSVSANASCHSAEALGIVKGACEVRNSLCYLCVCSAAVAPSSSGGP